MDMRLFRGLLVMMQPGKKHVMNCKRKDKAMKPASENIAEDNMAIKREQHIRKPSTIIFAP